MSPEEQTPDQRRTERERLAVEAAEQRWEQAMRDLNRPDALASACELVRRRFAPEVVHPSWLIPLTREDVERPRAPSTTSSRTPGSFQRGLTMSSRTIASAPGEDARVITAGVILKGSSAPTEIDPSVPSLEGRRA